MRLLYAYMTSVNTSLYMPVVLTHNYKRLLPLSLTHRRPLINFQVGVKGEGAEEGTCTRAKRGTFGALNYIYMKSVILCFQMTALGIKSRDGKASTCKANELSIFLKRFSRSEIFI